MLHSLDIEGYRSLRRFRLDLGPVNVITGGNGVGKSNLYRALYLVKMAAEGRLAVSLLEEGGMSSVLWAGGYRRRTTRKKPPKRVRIAVELDDFCFEIAIGLPIRMPEMPSPFDDTDPEVKEEWVWLRRPRRPSTTYLERKSTSLFIPDELAAFIERRHHARQR